VAANGVRILCSAHVHDITYPAHYAKNQARQQQAEEEERGKHLKKQLTGSAAFLDVHAQVGRPTNEEDGKHYLRKMSGSEGGEGDHYTLSMRALSKTEAMLTAEDEPLWARERFRADCAARAIRTCQDAERHYIRIWDARAALVRAHIVYTDGTVD
jgi:hypothetical protein